MKKLVIGTVMVVAAGVIARVIIDRTSNKENETVDSLMMFEEADEA